MDEATAVTASPTLAERVEELRRARLQAAVFAETLRSKRAAFEMQPDVAGLIESEIGAARFVAQLEEEVREATLAAYTETGNKKPVEGVGIRMVTRLEYEAERALEWATEHKSCLALDKKKFDAIAKAQAMPLPFVRVVEEAQATIARELPEGAA